jgi:hypothetical protein
MKGNSFRQGILFVFLIKIKKFWPELESGAFVF